jgi:P-type Ca2+ transporter type 2C
MQWHNLTVAATLEELDTSRSGLSEAKAKERLHQHGPNELTEKGKRPAIMVFLRQFASPSSISCSLPP